MAKVNLQPGQHNPEQVIAPPQKQEVQELPPTPERVSSFLQAAGWTEVGRNERGDILWADPAGEGPKGGTMEPTAKIPSRDGMDETILQQLVVGPCPWSYPTWEAVGIQRARDRAASQAPKPIPERG